MALLNCSLLRQFRFMKRIFGRCLPLFHSMIEPESSLCELETTATQAADKDEEGVMDLEAKYIPRDMRSRRPSRRKREQDRASLRKRKREQDRATTDVPSKKTRPQSENGACTKKIRAKLSSPQVWHTAVLDLCGVCRIAKMMSGSPTSQTRRNGPCPRPLPIMAHPWLTHSCGPLSRWHRRNSRPSFKETRCPWAQRSGADTARCCLKLGKPKINWCVCVCIIHLMVACVICAGGWFAGFAMC